MVHHRSEQRLEGPLNYPLDYACLSGRGRAQDSRLFFPALVYRVYFQISIMYAFVEMAALHLVNRFTIK